MLTVTKSYCIITASILQHEYPRVVQ